MKSWKRFRSVLATHSTNVYVLQIFFFFPIVFFFGLTLYSFYVLPAVALWTMNTCSASFHPTICACLLTFNTRNPSLSSPLLLFHIQSTFTLVCCLVAANLSYSFWVLFSQSCFLDYNCCMSNNSSLCSCLCPHNSPSVHVSAESIHSSYFT